ncbi:hypothetical protein NX786_23270 [Telluria mixta]|uniref:Uncharacterized protein n=1 Tax=Telluria mixta TaxID=34071 RepID=A0ABT2C6H5_9BURK|nr:hypothetical protein [Telluria mixta]MCS0632254.1 hypothetical protein [Telluria mixta]WEM94989.1 hypothetical protein P0M04_26385 [Telluria mixta]
MRATFAPSASIAGTPGKAGPARLAFVLLFPGFFFYQTLIGMGAMGAFLGGYFSVVSIGLFPPLATMYYLGIKASVHRVTSTDRLFGFFLLYFFVIVATNAAFGANSTIVKTHLLSILYFINIYLIFKHCDFSERKTIATTLAALLLMSATIFFFSQDGSFQPGQFGDPASPDSVATYQELARSYVLTFVTVISFTRVLAVRLVLYAMAAAALFLNGARSELVAALFLFPMIELYRAKHWLPFLYLVLLVFGLASIDSNFLANRFPESRVWELFDLSHSSSASARHELTDHALHTIAENPVLGAYASYPPGGYSHNILSAWVDLGLFGFVYMLFMLARAAVGLCTHGWLVRPRSGHFLLAWSLICISLLLLVTAKTFDDMFFGAAMGAYANYRSRKQVPEAADNVEGELP